jgi:metal-dependent hydrolase (beta-lactamase superfamily II)
VRPTAVTDNGEVPDALIAEHGFSALVAVAKGDREYRLLYDAGTSPDGVVENMRRRGHAGVVNIARYARRLTGDQPLYALLGGFHLNGPVFEPLIPPVLDDLHPSVLVPAHCTGWRAQHAMSTRFGPAFIPNSVGTSFHL